MSNPFLRTLALCLVACDAVGATAAIKAPEPTTLTQFAKHEQYIDARISPDGRYLAVTYPQDDVVGLGIIDLSSQKLTGTLRFSHQQHVNGFWWVSPERVVVAMAKSFGPLDQPYLTGELYAINADGSGKTYLHGYQGGTGTGTHIAGVRKEYAAAYMIDPLPRDPAHALIAVESWRNHIPEYRIQLLDVRNGIKQNVSAITAGYLGPGSVATDVAGHARYALGITDDLRRNEYLHDVEAGTWKLVQQNDKYTSIRLVGVSEDARTVYLFSNQGSDRTCLRSRDLVSLELKTLACNEHVDVDGVPMSTENGRPVAVGFEDGLPSVELIEKDSTDAKAYKTLLKSFSGQRVRVTSKTLDGKQMVVAVNSDRNPGDFYLLDLTKMKAEYLFSSRPWIDPAAMNSATPIEVRARDGRLLSGYLISAGGIKPEKRPMVIMPHGGPHGVRDYWEWDMWSQYLASLGYAVLQVNYRGSGGYGSSFEHDGYRHWGTSMQDDLTDSVAWAVKAGIADGARVCIMGASYGGYAALMSAVKEPDLYRCAIAYAGVYNLATQSSDSDIARSHFGRDYLSEVVGVDKEELLRNSPISYIDKLKAPVLIAHGDADERVPFSQAKELRQELDRQNKNYEWMPFKGEEHGFYAEADEVRFLEAVRAFLARNIGVAAVTPAVAPVLH
ncbi:alpha/beta hydrolase family protein [Hydrocarboniphaga sp.]|uniref:alpha/beta hydrolase family protein n=1 Tax=Hydrocarboniphaga sp. TaxID=2033016 RepID=UPI003D0BF8AC